MLPTHDGYEGYVDGHPTSIFAFTSEGEKNLWNKGEGNKAQISSVQIGHEVDTLLYCRGILLSVGGNPHVEADKDKYNAFNLSPF